MSSKKIVLVAISTVMFSLAACVPSNQTGTSYSRTEARTVQNIQIGTVLDSTAVTIEGTKTGAGGIIGGAVGAISGSGVNDGIEGEIASVLLGAAGAALGAKAEEKFTKKAGMEYTIRLESGKIISVVQAVDPKADAIVAGDAVKLLTQGSTYRVAKLNNAFSTK